MTLHLVLAHGGHWAGLLLPAGMLGAAVYFIRGGGGKPGSKSAGSKSGDE